MKVIAFEGTFSSNSHVTWGTAVLSNSEYVYNNTLGRKLSFETFENLEFDKHVTRIPNPINIIKPIDELDNVILCIVRRNSFIDFKPTKEEMTYIVGVGFGKDHMSYVFKDLCYFDDYANRICDQLAAFEEDIMQVGMILNHNHPHFLKKFENSLVLKKRELVQQKVIDIQPEMDKLFECWDGKLKEGDVVIYPK